MGNVLAAVAGSGSTRRIVALAIGVLAIGLNRYLGLELNELDKEAIAAMVMFFMGQSAWKETSLAKAEAAGVTAVAAIQATPQPDKLAALRAMLADEEARAASQKGPQP